MADNRTEHAVKELLANFELFGGDVYVQDVIWDDGLSIFVINMQHHPLGEEVLREVAKGLNWLLSVRVCIIEYRHHAFSEWRDGEEVSQTDVSDEEDAKLPSPAPDVQSDPAG